MGLLLHQLASAAYLLAAIAAVLAVTVRRPELSRGAAFALGIGVLLHTAAFWQLHTLTPTPAMNSLPLAISLASWIGVLVYLLLLIRVRGEGLALAVAPAAFLGTVFGWLSLQDPKAAVEPLHPLWSHLHVLLASCGLATLGVAGAAGLLYVLHHRGIKTKRSRVGAGLPALETLDRVNTIALGLGFLLLTLGVVTGVLWVRATQGLFWAGGIHANATLIAWAVYAAATYARFGLDVGARASAVVSAAGFAFLSLAVVGIGAMR